MGWFLGYIWCVCLLLDVVGLCTPMKFKPPGFPGTFGGAWGFLGYSHGWALENPKELGSPGMIEKPFLHISAWASRCWSLNGFLFAQLLILMEKTHSLLLWFVFLLASHCTWSVSQQCVCVHVESTHTQASICPLLLAKRNQVSAVFRFKPRFGSSWHQQEPSGARLECEDFKSSNPGKLQSSGCIVTCSTFGELSVLTSDFPFMVTNVSLPAGHVPALLWPGGRGAGGRTRPCQHGHGHGRAGGWHYGEQGWKNGGTLNMW